MNPSKCASVNDPLFSGFGLVSALVVLVWLLIAAPAQAQACTPFLEVLSPDRQTSVLSLTTCEVSAAEPWAESPSSKVWQLTAAAQQRWAAALQSKTLLLPRMDAQLRIRHLAEGLRSGPLLDRISARLVDPASWRWDARRGELALWEANSVGVNSCRVEKPMIFWFGARDIAQGGQLQAQARLVHSPAYVQDLPNSCVDAWRIQPAQYATVDQEGQVRIAEGTPHGTEVMLIALVGPKEMRGEMRVIDLRSNPLVGTWRQISETPCDSATARMPADPVREFKIDGSGNFAVTISPFEAYKDYWGTYTFDPASGAVQFSLVSGNKVPKGIKLSGRATSTADELELNDIALWPSKDGLAICSVKFVLQRR